MYRPESCPTRRTRKIGGYRRRMDSRANRHQGTPCGGQGRGDLRSRYAAARQGTLPRRMFRRRDELDRRRQSVTPDMMFPATACSFRTTGCDGAWGSIFPRMLRFLYAYGGGAICWLRTQRRPWHGQRCMTSILNYQTYTCVLFGDGSGRGAARAASATMRLLDFVHDGIGSGGKIPLHAAGARCHSTKRGSDA